MDSSSKPRYDQAPENFSESGQRKNRRTYSWSATKRAGDESGTHLDEQDGVVVDNETRGGGSTADSSYSVYSLTGLRQFVREEGGRVRIHLTYEPRTT